MSEKSPWVLDFEARWATVLDQLTKDGFTAEVPNIAAPVEVLGSLPSGERFYMHCRGDSCSVQISKTGDPVDTWQWRGEVARKMAGHLSPEDAGQTLRELTIQYMKEARRA